MNVTVFGKGNIGSAVGAQLEKAGNQVDYVTTEHKADAVADLVILAVPYAALASIAKEYQQKFAGKTIVETTNPVNFKTFDSLDVPADSSATAQLQADLPDSHVLKAFNTVFAANLASGKVGDNPVEVLTAGDNKDSKELLQKAFEGSDLNIVDAGSLRRARELESIGFLQMTLAVTKQIAWTGGFAVVK